MYHSSTSKSTEYHVMLAKQKAEGNSIPRNRKRTRVSYEEEDIADASSSAISPSEEEPIHQQDRERYVPKHARKAPVMSSHPLNNNVPSSSLSHNATMFSPRRASVEFQHSHPAPQRPPSSASRRSTPVPVQNGQVQLGQHRPNGIIDDVPGFPVAFHRAPEGYPLFTRAQVQSEIDRQCYIYRRDADQLGEEYKGMKGKIMSLEAEIEKATQTLEKANENDGISGQHQTAEATATLVTLRARLDEANTQIADLSAPRDKAELERMKSEHARKVAEFKQQLGQMRGHYEGQAAKEKQPMPRRDPEVASLRRQVATLTGDLAATKQRETQMRVACVQQLSAKEQQINAVKVTNTQLLSASHQSSDQLAAARNEITTLRDAYNQLDEANTQLQEANDQAQRDIDKVNSSLFKEQDKWREEKRKSQSTFNHLQNENTRLENQVAKGKYDIRVQDDALRETKASLTDECDQHLRNLAVKDEQLRQARQNAPAALREGLRIAQEQVKALQQELRGAKDQLQALQRNPPLPADYEAIKEELRVTKERFAALEGELRVAKDQMQAMEEELAVKTEQVEKLKGKSSESPEQAAQAQKLLSTEERLHNLRKYQEELRKTVKLTEEENAKLKAENTALKADVEEIKGDMETLQKEVQAKESLREVAVSKAASLERKLKRVKGALDENEERAAKKLKIYKSEPED